MKYLIASVFWVVVIWLIRRDTARREGISSALWIPTLWVGILASRPIAMWLGFGGATDTLEGSPVDRLFYLGLILAAVFVLFKRRLDWSAVISRNWPVLLFYFYLLLSVLWADTPFVSFKRWFKDFGNVFVALVVLTEVNWEQAFRAVFVRCAYVLIPLSVILIRYFPDQGRSYSRYGGLQITGVTAQKNSLGAMVLVCGLILIWDWFERSQPDLIQQRRFDRYLPAGLLAIGAYLLYLCDSKTSIACLIVGACILAAARLPLLRRRISALGVCVMAAGIGFYVLDSVFSLKEELIQSMGRDMTFTGRTDVWRELLALKTDPILGTGFCSFWSDRVYQSRLPDWLAEGRSTHNGYLEVYIDGGTVGLFFLGLMLVAIGLRINRQLGDGGYYPLVRFAIFVVMLIGNLSESHFGRMSPVGFLFLLAALDPPAAQQERTPQEVPHESPALTEQWADSAPWPMLPA